MGKKTYLGINIEECICIGKGLEGKVYLTPDGKALKIFNSARRCKEEYEVMKEVEGNTHFPKAFDYEGRYLLREYVEGLPIKEYIRQKGLSRQLALNLIHLAEDFEKLKIVKLDGVNNHVFVQEDESIKVIDLRRKKYFIYMHLFKTLKKEKVLDDFMKVLEEVRPELASKWMKK